jgi:hypothetical protein
MRARSDDVCDCLGVNSTVRAVCRFGGVEAGCVCVNEGMARDEADEGGGSMS